MPSARATRRAAVMSTANAAHAAAQQQIEGLDAHVEAARQSVYMSLNSVMAVRHVLEHTAAQHERVGETLGKLDVEEDDLRRETRARGLRSHGRAGGAEPRTGRARARSGSSTPSRKSELATARGEHEERAREVRTREQELAAVEARLASLQELATSRADFGDAARMVLVQANGHVGQQGAVADYVDVDRRYERAVEACLGELLEHVIVERHDQAAAGLSLVRQHDAGRCGFVVVDPGSNGYHPREVLRVPGIVPVADVLRVQGPHAITIQKVLPEAYVADTFEQAVSFSRQTSAPIATLEGDVLSGPHLVTGGAKVESRGILATRREIKELGERVAVDREQLARLLGGRRAARADDRAGHRRDRRPAGRRASRRKRRSSRYEAQRERADEESARLARKAEVIAVERRTAEEERAALEVEARRSRRVHRSPRERAAHRGRAARRGAAHAR